LRAQRNIYSFPIDNYYEGIYYSFRVKGLYRIYLENGAINTGTKTTSPINGIFVD
jgi:hypothetical protein